MPRIPQLPIQKQSRISDFKLSTPRPADISVPRGRPGRPVNEGGAVIGAAIQELGVALKKVSQNFAEKEELTRIADSQKQQFKVNEYFRGRKEAEAQMVGSQALGLVDKLKEDTADIREQFITDEMNPRTVRELTQHFNSQYNKHASWLVNHAIKQSAVADNEARVRAIQDSHTNIASLEVGDQKGIEQEITNTLKFEQARHPNITEDQMETNRRSLREDYVTFALTKWASDNPTAVIDFWEKNQVYLKSALPQNYNIMSKKMEAAQVDSNYDVALGQLERMFDDDAAAAKFVDEDTKGFLNLTASQRLKMSSALWANNNYKIAEEERAKAKREEEYSLDIHKKYFDKDTRTLNTPVALADLEQAYRKGKVDTAFYTAKRKQLLAGGDFSNTQSQELLRNINNLEVTTKGEIMDKIMGTNANPEPYFAELKRRQDQVNKGFTSNWFDVAYAKFRALSGIKKTGKLPSGIKEKELLVSMTELPAFKKRLEEVARKAGLSAGDPEIVDLADTLLQGGWYSEKDPGFHPGKAGWGKWITSEKYQRLWEFPDEEINKVLEAQGIETATGGNQEPIQKYSPEEEEAIKLLAGQGLAVTPERIEQVKAYLKKNKGEE